MAKRGKMNNQQSTPIHHKPSTTGEADVKTRNSSPSSSEVVGLSKAIKILKHFAATGTSILYLGGSDLNPVVFPGLLAGPDEDGSFLVRGYPSPRIGIPCQRAQVSPQESMNIGFIEERNMLVISIRSKESDCTIVAAW